MTHWRGAQFATLGTILLAPFSALAAGGLPDKIVTCTGVIAGAGLKVCTLCELADTAQNVLNTAIYFMIVLAAVLFAWAGWLAVSSAGDTSEYTAAKKIFNSVIIGIFIALCGWLIIDTLMKTFLGGQFGPWNKVCNVSPYGGANAARPD